MNFQETGYTPAQHEIRDVWNGCMERELDTNHKHCVFMNSLVRPTKTKHLECFERNIGVLFGNKNDGYRYNLELLSTFNHPTTPKSIISHNQRLSIYRNCYGKHYNLLSDEDINVFWKCAEAKMGGYHPSLYGWKRVFPEKKLEILDKCKMETGLTKEDYFQLCKKRNVTERNISYLLCIGRISGLNNGHCYFGDRGIDTLVTTFDERIARATVLRCLDLVIHDEVFDFKIYYNCIFNSNLFGETCFV